MNLHRHLFRTAWAAWAMVAVPLTALAQGPDYPARAVKLLVANGPGSAPDILARQVGQQLAKGWGQPVLVENKGSAGGVSAVDAVVKSAPDGHTLLVGGDGAITIMPHLQQHLPYDVKQDLVPIIKLGQVDFVLVAHPRHGFKTVQDLVKAAKARPGGLNYASAGTGSALHLSMELLKQRAGFFATHIPYRGGPQGLQDVLAGQVDAMFIAVAPALAHIQSGKLVALAVTTPYRSKALPEVPTMQEAGLADYAVESWQGFVVPASTPRPLVERIHRDVVAVLREPETATLLENLGFAIAASTPEAVDQTVRDDIATYRRVIATADVKLQ